MGKQKKISIIDIREILTSHSSETPANFNDINLGGIGYFCGHDLSKASFKASNCYGLDLSGCQLFNCNFTGAEGMAGIILDNAKMDIKTADMINLLGGRLPGSVKIYEGGNEKQFRLIDQKEVVNILENQPVDFSWCRFDKTTVNLMVLRDLSGGIFRFTNCDGLNFYKSKLVNCDFTGAFNLETANFEGCRMDRETMDTIKERNGKLTESVIMVEG